MQVDPRVQVPCRKNLPEREMYNKSQKAKQEQTDCRAKGEDAVSSFVMLFTCQAVVQNVNFQCISTLDLNQELRIWSNVGSQPPPT